MATEHRPAGDRCGRVQMNVDIVESRRNGPQLSTRHDDDDTVRTCVAFFCPPSVGDFHGSDGSIILS